MKRISWYFRKYHIKISPLIIYVNDTWDGWGFNLLAINKNLKDYSLLKLSWRSTTGLPQAKVDFYGDFLFLRNYLYKTFDDMRDEKTWNQVLWDKEFSRWDKIKFKLLQKLFKQ